MGFSISTLGRAGSNHVMPRMDCDLIEVCRNTTELVQMGLVIIQG